MFYCKFCSGTLIPVNEGSLWLRCCNINCGISKNFPKYYAFIRENSLIHEEFLIKKIDNIYYNVAIDNCLATTSITLYRIINTDFSSVDFKVTTNHIYLYRGKLINWDYKNTNKILNKIETILMFG